VEKLFDQTRIAACKVCAPHFFVLWETVRWQVHKVTRQDDQKRPTAASIYTFLDNAIGA
jgi:hypothetical protein